MKFVYNVYVLIIILRSTWVVQNAADFTLDELTHLSRALSPMECMRLLESIYLAMPKEKEHRVVTIRETPMNKWISKQACLSELKAWNQQFPDKTEPKARVIMIMHLSALGKTDLANYVRKKEDRYDKKKGKISKERIVKRDTSENSHPHSRKITHGVEHSTSKTSGRNDQYKKIHHSMIPAISGTIVTNGRQSGPGKIHPRKWKHTGVSRNSLYLMISLGIVVIFICGIVFLIFRRSLRSSPCRGERSDLCPRNNLTQEKGLQCIRFLNDLQCDYETQSNMVSQISEIDVEGGSCFNSLGVESRKNFSDAVSCTERITPEVSMEELELFDEESETEILEETLAQSSCRCRPVEKKICGPKPKKKKKNKVKVKSKEETKTTKSYLKAMQEKILPRQRRQFKKDSNFDMKQFREKILAVLNQECGVCRCCNCTPHWEVDSPKVTRSTRNDEKCIRHEKKERKTKPLKRDKCKKLSVTKGCDKEMLPYQASVTSRSPMSDEQSTRKQGSDSAKTSKIQNKEKSGKPGSPRVKKTRDNKAFLSSSESSETDQSQFSNNDSERRSILKSKQSKQKEASVNTSRSAHDKPKRFF